MSKNLKIGIIGGGRIGKVHAANLTTRVSGVEVAVMADPFAGKELETWAADRGITRVIKDYKLILNDAAIDAVLICSPTDTHASISQEAALAGKHIFCEKPLNQDPDVIRKTLEVVKKAGVVFQIGFNRRFDHNFRALRQAVVDGSVGDVTCCVLHPGIPSRHQWNMCEYQADFLWTWLFMTLTWHAILRAAKL